MPENKIQILLEMIDKASPEFKKVNQSVIEEVKRLEGQTSSSFKKNDDTIKEHNRNLLRLTLTIASIIRAYNLVANQIKETIRVGREMDSSFNESMNSFDISILRVQQSIAQKLIPVIQTAADFWTKFLNNSFGQSGGFIDDLKNAEENLAKLKEQLQNINLGSFVKNNENISKINAMKLAIQDQIDMQEKLIETLKKQADAQKEASGFERNIELVEANQILQQYADTIKEITTLFIAGKTDADTYFDTLTSKENAAFEEAQLRASTLKEIASLENQVNNTSLMDFLKVSEAKKKSLQEIKDAALMTTEQMLQATASSLSRLGSALKAASQQHKEFARAGQIVAIAEATMLTYLAVQRARASALPPLNYILAGIELAAGLLNVSNIAAQKFAAGTPSVPSDMLAEVHRGETIIPQTFAESIRRGDLTLSGNGGGSIGDINIFIQGGISSDGMSVGDMAEKLGFEFERRLRTARSF